ncbi:MAG: transcriptional repressor LexA [Oscillospiraceae bacterium]|nr:transcriptional repressor LexA [Oscillospiraceae bacterium]
MKPLSAKQQRVLEYLQQRTSDGVPPSVREICAATGIKSTSSVHTYLKELEDAGYITREGRLNRSIRLPGDGVARVPLLGRVTAGQPILAVEEIEDYIPYAGGHYPAAELFALRVRGDSMLGAGINDGDVVIVHRTPEANDGDIVVALLGDEATVKRFFREKKGFRLQPENDAYEPILAKELAVLGKVVSLVRYL